MGARGKHRNVRRKGNSKSSRNQKPKRNTKVKQRKTYSLYKLTQHDKTETVDLNKPVKKRVHEQPKTEKFENESSTTESEEETEDVMKKLLETFGNDSKRQKRSMAIESSDDSSSDEEQNDETEVIDNNTQESLLTVTKDSQAIEDDDEEQEEDSELKENAEDPFSLHISHELSSSLRQSVQSTPMLVNSFTETWPNLGKLTIQIPKCDTEPVSETFSITGETKFAPPGKVPVIYNTKQLTCDDSFIKVQILENVRKANSSRTNKAEHVFTPLQNEIFSVINNYQDLYYPHRTFENAEEIRFVYTVHAVNHILKTRMKVIHHNARLSKKDDVPEEFRDQGLVRPKVSVFFSSKRTI